MRVRNAFSMLELIFVIVIMGIIGKFGTEFLIQSYDSFIFSNINNKLQSRSGTAVEFIASRLQYRIKDSVIVRTGETKVFDTLASANPSTDYVVLEWVASDIEGFRGTTEPLWSGIIDLDAGVAGNFLLSPETNTTAINNLIVDLSDGDSTFDATAALYFIGSNSDQDGYGWDGNATIDQFQTMHPVKAGGTIDTFIPRRGDDSVTNSLTGVDVYEYYKLAWTANAIVMENYGTGRYAGENMGDLVFYYDYQPWNGQKFYDGGNIKSFTLMEGVSTFQTMAIGSIIKIQVCTSSKLIAEDRYSLCKEKTIY